MDVCRNLKAGKFTKQKECEHDRQRFSRVEVQVAVSGVDHFELSAHREQEQPAMGDVSLGT